MGKSNQKNIDEWVALAKKGDSEAFGLVYDELVQPIYRYIYYRVAPTIAEDLTEETFLKAWGNLKFYKKGKHPFSSWLFKIAHNLVCDYYRKNKSTSEIHENIVDTDRNNSPAFRINVKLNQVKLRKAIHQLPDHYQQVVILKYINELDNSEIAKMIGKSEGAVRTIQFRALGKLRVLLEKDRKDF